MDIIKHATNNATLAGSNKGHPIADAPATIAYDVNHRQAIVITFWQPTEEEIANILAGQPVALVIMGQSVPPMRLCVYTNDRDLFGT